MARFGKLRLLAESAAVYAAAWAYLHQLQFLTPNMPGTDAYYHIKIAWIMRVRGLLDRFPWATQSLWTEHFYDKDFGFHLALIPFTFGDLLTGAKLAAVTYGAAIFLSLFLVLRLRRVPFSGIWVFLLAASGGYFVWRISMPRPHLLAIVFSIWSLFCVIERRWIAAGLTGILYGLCYTAPLLPVYAGIFAVLRRMFGHPIPWRTVAAGLGGVAVGWVVHPHFPNNFIGGVPVAVSVPAGVLGSAWGLGVPDLALGGEALPSDTRTFLMENLVIFVAALGSVYALNRPRVRLTPEMLTLAFVGLAFFVGACLTVRFVEHFVPLSLWVCAEIIGAWVRTWRTRTPLRNPRVALAAVAVVAFSGAAFALGDQSSRLYLSHPSPSKRRFAAEWLEKHTPPNSIVFTCDWDDAPELFFYDHSNRYLVFLDPIYVYQWKPQRWKTWRRVARGRDPNPVGTILNTFHAHYGFCTSAFKDFREQLENDPRVRIRLENRRGYVFEIHDALEQRAPPA